MGNFESKLEKSMSSKEKNEPSWKSWFTPRCPSCNTEVKTEEKKCPKCSACLLEYNDHVKTEGTAENWENGKLGCDPRFARKSSMSQDRLKALQEAIKNI